LIRALREHWPEYLIEATGLGIFMISAGFFATILEYPGSPVREAVENPFLRRIPMGLAMGVTAVAIIYSPWGKRSGAHINPAVTLSFFRLGKVKPWDAIFYVMSQFIGGSAGIVLIGLFLGSALARPPVNYVITVPGSAGIIIAFIAEAALSFGLMLTVLFSTNRKNLNSYSGLFAGTLVALYIIFEAPLSGMSINPARSFASALPANIWIAFWIYLTAPTIGMLIAAELYVRLKGIRHVYCAKLHHNNEQRCIFNCRYPEIPDPEKEENVKEQQEEEKNVQ
jgi:aquaporin Z